MYMPTMIERMPWWCFDLTTSTASCSAVAVVLGHALTPRLITKKQPCINLKQQEQTEAIPQHQPWLLAA